MKTSMQISFFRDCHCTASVCNISQSSFVCLWLDLIKLCASLPLFVCYVSHKSFHVLERAYRALCLSLRTILIIRHCATLNHVTEFYEVYENSHEIWHSAHSKSMSADIFHIGSSRGWSKMISSITCSKYLGLFRFIVPKHCFFLGRRRKNNDIQLTYYMNYECIVEVLRWFTQNWDFDPRMCCWKNQWMCFSRWNLNF